jgi:hypothetical protein
VYDEDFANFQAEQAQEAKRLAARAKLESQGFKVYDSGVKTEYDDGMHRDTAEGKPKFRLMWPEGVPLEEQLLYRTAMHYTKGGELYGDRNWEKSCTEESLAHHADATERHLHKFLLGVEDGEDHAAAVVWGINAVLLTRRNIAAKAELDRMVKAAPEGTGQTPVEHENFEYCLGHEHGTDEEKAPEPEKFEYTQLNLWMEAGETKFVNGSSVTNDGTARTFCIPIHPSVRLIEVKDAPADDEAEQDDEAWCNRECLGPDSERHQHGSADHVRGPLKPCTCSPASDPHTPHEKGCPRDGA